MTQSNNYIVHKFGGSSLVNADSYKTVAARLNGQNEIIVVSAIKGITSALQKLLDVAVRGDDFQKILEKIANQHASIIKTLLSEKKAERLIEQLQKDIVNIHDLLHATSLINEYSEKMQSAIIGYGEKWSAKILTSVLSDNSKSLFLDATDVLCTYKKNGILHIDCQHSKNKLEAFLRDKSFEQLVITGFLACDEQEKQITLGRNSSDYSAAIFAKLMCAKELVIWKDVEGVFSADPTRVRSAFPIAHLSYESALELAYFGASVIHPKTITPAMELSIPIYIKNIFNPQASGTVISYQSERSNLPVQGITSIDHIALVTIEGTGLIGVSGTAVRVFQVLQQLNISVILISQASSEHSICLAVELSLADEAVKALVNAFEFELQQGQIERIYANKNCAILAIVGDGMVGTIGIAGKLMATLTNANINIKAIAQGSSERNISIVIARDDINKALRAVHAGFYLSDKTLSIGIIGPGLVGSALIRQIRKALKRLQQQYHVKLLVRGICNSKKMHLSHQAIDLSNWETYIDESQQAVDLDLFSEHIIADDIPHAVIIDCTASASVSDQYIKFISKGAHVITPNKRANSGNLSVYRHLKSQVHEKSRHYLYETTVCAGLPVITTLHDIIQTGDEVLKIEGVVSGTLSYIFNQLAEGLAFSQIIKEAKALGYTEPDPREDLSGMDVARKIVILARELGFGVTMDDVKVHNLVPKPLTQCSTDTFMQELPKYDAQIKANIQANIKDNEQAVYVGAIHNDGTVEVGIKSFPMSHPFARLKGTDNMLIFHTHRYNELPLVIQGPGAGAEVTAAGVFADLLRLVSFIGK